MSYDGLQERQFPATFRTKLGVDDDGTRHVIVEGLVGGQWQQVARLGSVETDKFLTNESMGGYRYKHHNHKQASGVATEYFMLRMSTGGDGTSVICGNYDGDTNYLATGTGGWKIVSKIDEEVSLEIGDKQGSYEFFTDFTVTATLEENMLMSTMDVECEEDISKVGFNTTIISNDLTTVFSKHQKQQTYDALSDENQRYKFDFVAGVNVLPLSQPFPLGESETVTIRYQFKEPVKLRTNSDGSVWGHLKGKGLTVEQVATREWVDRSNANIFITNITSSGNVVLTRKAEPNDEVVEGVELSSLTATVSVEWDRGSNYEGVPTVNGVAVTKTGKIGGNTYIGTANISGEYSEIIAELNGTQYIVPLSTLDKPLVSLATFNDTYPTGQTELKENDTFNIDITCDVPYVSVEIQEFEACKGSTFTTSGSVSGIIANRGNVAVERNARIRVRNEAGTWSDWVLTDNNVNCNNLHPSVTFTNVNYPASQQALKNSEEVNIDYIATHSDNEIITVTPNLILSTNGAIRNSGDYESGTYTITATREANGAITTNNTTVRIAHAHVALSNNTPVQVRSGLGAVALPCMFTQELLGAFTNPTILATDSNTHSLNIIKEQVPVTNLAGKEIILDRPYFIKGFAPKTLTLEYPDAIANIGTNIVDKDDVVVSGVINSTPSYAICTNRVETAGNIVLVGDYALTDTNVVIDTQICNEFNYESGTTITITIEEV